MRRNTGNAAPAHLHHPLPSLKPVESTTMRDQVTQSVRTALMNGHLQPGQPVTVKAISSMHNASVMPAREAMNRLIAEGALELRPNRTVIVPMLSRREFDELTDLRCHVEGVAASRATGYASKELVARLQRLDAQMRDAALAGDADAYLNGNFEFHFTMYRLGASAFVLSIIEKLWVRVGPLIRSCFSPVSFEDSGRNHAQIISALAREQSESLRAAVIADIAVAADAIRASHFASFSTAKLGTEPALHAVGKS